MISSLQEGQEVPAREQHVPHVHAFLSGPLKDHSDSSYDIKSSLYLTLSSP
jgi:hypothetical protein